MEKGCILPDNLLKELSEDDNLVLYSLSRFCNCKAEELLEVLRMRNKSIDNKKINWTNYSEYGYRKYRKKIGKKTRLISEPDDKLKKIQDIIKGRLSFIPVSFASTAGKIGDNVEKNAEIHRKNLYLIAMDIKDAYPSINTHRVYKNLQGALLSPLKYRCPYLEEPKDKDLFVRAITHLCVSEDQLPQGASTSNQIQNIVMTGFDAKIEKKLPELVGPKSVYSRYADDITISFPNFLTMDVLKEKIQRYISEIEKWNQSESSDIGELNQIINDFSKDTFNITDNFELKYLQGQIEEIKGKIKKLQISEEEVYSYIGIINGFKQNIKNSKWRIGDIADEIMQIIGSEGWKLNPKKTNIWTPQSNTDRSINGMTFDRDGKRGLDKQKKALYLGLLDDLNYSSIEELSKNNFYKHKFKLGFYGMVSSKDSLKLIEESISGTVKGIKNYMTKIYGVDNVPKELDELSDKCLQKRQNYSKRKEIEYIKRKDRKGNISKNEKPYDYNFADDGLTEKDDLPF